MYPIHKYNLCRLCLFVGDQLMNIFEENETIDFIAQEAIEDLLQFKVVKEAGFPWLVCASCLGKLTDFRLFKRRCNECKVTFEQRYQNVEESDVVEIQPEELQIKEETYEDSIGHGEVTEEGGLRGGSDDCAAERQSRLAECETAGGDFMKTETREELGSNENISAGDIVEVKVEEVLASARMGEGAMSNFKQVISCNDSSDNGRSANRIGWPECGINRERTELSVEMRERNNREEYSSQTIKPEGIVAVTNEELKSEDDDETELPKADVLNTSAAALNIGAGIDMVDLSGSQYWPRHVDNPASSSNGEEEAGGDSGMDCMEEKIGNAQDAMLSTELFGGVLGDDEVKPRGTTFNSTTSNRNPAVSNKEPVKKTAGSNSVNSLSCQMCRRSFGRAFCLSRHMKLVHGINPLKRNRRKKRVPPQTTKVATVSATATASEKKDYICGECGKKFLNNRRLRRHLLIHREDKNFHECDICHKMFSRKGNLRFHLKTVHLKEKDFVCALCGIEFSHKGHFNSHMRIHNGQKPHACTICGWRFSNRTDMRKHLVVHSRRFQTPAVNP